MKNTFIFIITILAFLLNSCSKEESENNNQIPISIEWQKCIGGSEDDFAYDIQQTIDGGYAIAGCTSSFDGDASDNEGMNNCLAVKLSASGDTQWQKCIGSGCGAYSIRQTNSRTYLLVGYLETNFLERIGWIVRLSSAGDIIWGSVAGGTGINEARNIQLTVDGGYIFAGYTKSNGSNSPVPGYHEEKDCWVVKDFIRWQKCLGGSADDEAWSIQQTTDGGYIVAGYTYSTDGDVTGNHGESDCWVVKLTNSGNIEWQKCLGGTDEDYAYSIQRTSDGGYIIAGYTYSTDGDVTGNHGESDCWVVKLTNSGNIEWQKCLGGTEEDIAYSIQQTTDGGYIVAGSTYSHDKNVTDNHGNSDCWVVKLTNSGNIEWQKCLGGTRKDIAQNIYQSNDGGYIIVGYTESDDGDVSGNHGKADYWVVKLSPDAE